MLIFQSVLLALLAALLLFAAFAGAIYLMVGSGERDNNSSLDPSHNFPNHGHE